jgi:RNAse (barnase) inhibitor barstar
LTELVLNGEELLDAGAVYAALGRAIYLPAYFGANPDALWDVLSEYRQPRLRIVWRNADRSKALLGQDFESISKVLADAASSGLIRCFDLLPD